MPGDRVRHPDDERQQRNYESRRDDALHSPERLRREELSQALLEHAASQKSRLQTRSTATGFGDPEKELAISARVAERADDPLVTVHFDGEG